MGRLLAPALALVLAVGGVSGSVLTAGAGAQAVSARAQRLRAHGAEHFACASHAAAARPCYFSTPSGNVHCVWTPKPNSVTCELQANSRAYRLHPTGPAKAVHVKLTRRGQTLPTNQQLVFPESLSCQDTNTTITCNQDEGFGEFKLSPHGSHSA